ncbi:MAG: site-2 protease family protein, partial [Planctomycetes bacterium]|nr:site-2 protease family protein [Planctomycetota bacterium]
AGTRTSRVSALWRMAIISAGVVMNIITGMLFFAIAFSIGVEQPPSEIGGVHTAYPAWKAGIEYGDRPTRINDREIVTFGDIMRAVALSSGPIEVEGIRRDGKTPFQVTIDPDETGTKRLIGAGPQYDSLTVLKPYEDGSPVVWPETPAARADGEFRPGDEIIRVDDTEFADVALLEEYLARYDIRNRPVKFTVRRAGNGRTAGSIETITVAPRRFRTLGLRMQMGQIAAVQYHSPAAQVGLKPGDKLTHVDDQVVGAEIDPIELPDYLARRHGQEVELTVLRENETQPTPLTLVPRDKKGWVDPPSDRDMPLSAASIGIAYHVVPAVQHVEPGSPADRAGIQPGERVKKMVFMRGERDPYDMFSNPLIEQDVIEIPFGKTDEGKVQENWPNAFYLLQHAPARTVKLTVADEKGQTRELELKSAQVTDRDWFHPGMRGVRTEPLAELQKADNVLAAIGLGISHTKNWAVDIYLTLRNLVTGRISPKELHGPVGIARVAYRIAEQGIPELLLFLGMLSVNLAVLNFLPIPVLDGGHMVFLIWEGVTRRKPSEKVLVAATYAGFIFVLALMVAVLYLDIFVHRHIGN